MKRLLGILTATILFVGLLSAQPMSGSYTVGGTSPNFATLQAAANAVKARGVSGPVAFNIRPGIYMRDGGLSSVMILDSIIAGISPINRITFQPDEAAGGNVNNVLLQIDQTTQTSTALVSIQTDYTTIRNLTFQDVDSAEAGADYLLSINNTYPNNPTNEGIVVEGCRFLGNSHPTGGMVFGTDYGIVGTWAVSDIVIRRNSFQRLMRSVDIGYLGTAGSGRSYAGNVIVEDNEILKAHFGVTGAGGLRGHGILIQSHYANVRRNYLNNAGGRGSNEGIWVMADSGLVDRNTIVNGGGTIGSGGGQNPYYYGIDVRGISVLGGQAQYTMVVNNMISGCTSLELVIGINVVTKKAKIIHNTIVNSGGGGSSEIRLNPESDSCTVLNNILIENGSSGGNPAARIIFNQDWGMSGLISDYNVFYHSDPLALIATRGYPNWYSSLSSYQAATGLETHSIYKNIDFVNDTLYPHLSDCQAQDRGLAGIPFPGVVDDIDGDARSVTAPTRGADEGRMRSNPMFGDVFRRELPGTSFSIAPGKFDNLMADGLAVADYDNNQVLLYHNLPSSRSFVLSGTLQTGFIPTVVKFFDLDHDGHLDLVVGGQSATTIKVFWGDGAGGFPQDTTITTRGGVSSIDTGAVSFHNLRTIVLTENVAPGVSFLCFLLNNNGRHLQHATVQRPLGGGGGNTNDTIDAALYDIAVGDLDGNGSHEVAALGIDGWAPATPFIVFVDTSLGNHPWGHHNIVHGFNTATYVGHNSNIVMGRFTGGSLSDIITTGGNYHECIILKNHGSMNFSAEPIAANRAVGLAAMDYDNDGDLDFATINWDMQSDGVSVLLNNGAGHFTQEYNCFQKFGSGRPYSVVASDFDLDGKKDLAIVSQSLGGHDSLFVLYNFGNVTGIRSDPLSLTPTEFSLGQNYPNPFNPSTKITWQSPVGSWQTLKVYDILGSEVATLVNEFRPAGKYEVKFNASQLSSGIYFYSLRSGNFVEAKKMILIR